MTITQQELSYYACDYGAKTFSGFAANTKNIECPRKHISGFSLRRDEISVRYQIAGGAYYTFRNFQYCLDYSGSHSTLDATLAPGSYFNGVGGVGNHVFSALFDKKISTFIDIEVIGNVYVQVVDSLAVFGSFQSYQDPAYCSNGVLIKDCVMNVSIDFFSYEKDGGILCNSGQIKADKYPWASCVNGNSVTGSKIVDGK